MTAVRFDTATIEAVKLAAEARGGSVSDWIRDAVQREVDRRGSSPTSTSAVPPALRPDDCVSMALTIGPGDSWHIVVKTGQRAGRWCCEEGHGSPEDASAHGALLAIQALSAWARSLQPPAIGALILRGESTAA